MESTADLAPSVALSVAAFESATDEFDLNFVVNGPRPAAGMLYYAWVAYRDVDHQTGREVIRTNVINVVTYASSDATQGMVRGLMTRKQLANAVEIVVTMEPTGGSLGDGVRINAQQVNGISTSAQITLTMESAVGSAVRPGNSNGFILETPTTPQTDDYANGIWFINPQAGASSLQVGTTNNGWTFEAFATFPGATRATSLGRFKRPGAKDLDGAGPTAGPNAAPPFPGQDFVMPPRSLVGATIIVSLEPIKSVDNDDQPFFPLVQGKVVDAGAGVLQPLRTHEGVARPLTTTLTVTRHIPRPPGMPPQG